MCGVNAACTAVVQSASGPHDQILFFFNDTATTEIYTLSLHDALPILLVPGFSAGNEDLAFYYLAAVILIAGDRKSTRLNSSHSQISYAVFCLKKKTPFFSVLASAAAGSLTVGLDRSLPPTSPRPSSSG